MAPVLATAFTLLFALLLAACGGSTASRQPASLPTARDCGGLRFPYPDAQLTLTAADAGRSVTIQPGDLVEVDLLGPPDRHWSPIRLTGAGLRSLSTQAMTPTLGSQLGEYCAATLGSADLSSTSESANWKASIKIQ